MLATVPYLNVTCRIRKEKMKGESHDRKAVPCFILGLWLAKKYSVFLLKGLGVKNVNDLLKLWKYYKEIWIKL